MIWVNQWKSTDSIQQKRNDAGRRTCVLSVLNQGTNLAIVPTKKEDIKDQVTGIQNNGTTKGRNETSKETDKEAKPRLKYES
jgi:hypothetical protein